MKLAILASNTGIAAIGSLADGGYIKIYSGAQPASPETAASGDLLATLALDDPAFAAPDTRTITAETITGDPTADATGTAGYARLLQSDETTAIADLSVGTSGADINFNSVAFQAGAAVEITALSITLPQ